MPTLDALAGSGHDVVAVVTRPPARRGRGRKLVPSPVADAAQRLGLALIESARPGDAEVVSELERADAALGVVVAYGAILPPRVLEIPRLGWINLHFSDLPRWRGAAPVQHAIWARDTRTATSVFQLEPGLDTGPVFSRQEVALQGDETADSLLATLAVAGAAQTLAAVDEIADGTARSVPQDEGPGGANVTAAPRLTKQDAYVDFTRPSQAVSAHIRAATSNPGAWTTLDAGQVLRLGPVLPLPDVASPGVGLVIPERNRVLVGCAEGAVELGQVAPAGKKWMSAADWWRGARLGEGARLGGRFG